MLTSKEQRLLSALEEASSNDEVEIVTLEIVGAKRAPVIRIYIDTPTSVSFTELSDAQDWIGKVIEEIDPFPGAYTLEVSSPGIDRPLRTAEHFERFAGEDVRIRTMQPVEGSRNFKGVLAGIEEGIVKVKTDAGDRAIAIDNIQRANVIGKVEF